MFCTACGNTLNEGDKYCSQCGKANSPGAAAGGTFDPPRVKSARPLARSLKDKKIAGVASGLARYLDVNAVWVRLGFVALVFMYCFGLIAYIVLWMVMPRDDQSILQEA